MDSNKDEALRCVSIARDAIASGNKQRARKFIDIARRLNHNLSVDDLLAACENMNSGSAGPSSDEKPADSGKNKVNSRMVDEVSNGERNYTEEHVQLVSKIKRSRDYYDILGVERSCSVEEVKRAYRKLSLKVHPDKNKAPGSEEAFKKVSKAFKCLSNDDSKREYDQTGLVEDFDYGQQYNVRRRRRRTGNDLFDDDFDPDEVFRSFFGHGPHGDMFRPSHVYRTRAAANQGREENVGTGPNLILLLQILPFLIIFLLAYLPLSEPDYSLQKNYSYQLPRITEKHGIEFYVKSVDFDQNYPLGSPARASIEENVIKDYKNLLGRYCHIELQRRQWSRNLPTPHCDKLKSFGVA